MLTLADCNQVVNPDDDFYRKKANPTFYQMRAAYNTHLAGLDCLGMIDPALYVSMHRTHHVNRLIAYHCHLLIWNIDEQQLDRRCRAIRAKTDAFVEYATSAHFEPVKAADLRQVLWYCTKTPRSQYQLHRRETHRLRQYKRHINGVNAVRLYAETGRRTLEELTLAHGQGQAILNRTLRDARRWERRG